MNYVMLFYANGSSRFDYSDEVTAQRAFDQYIRQPDVCAALVYTENELTNVFTAHAWMPEWPARCSSMGKVAATS